VSLPAFALFEMVSPLIEFSGYLLLPMLWWNGLVDWSYVSTLLLLSLSYAILVSMLAVLLEDLAFRRYPTLRDLTLLMGGAVLENLGYRQLTVWWRVRAFWQYFQGDLSWGSMERRGVSAR
jgi:hypothetical protein